MLEHPSHYNPTITEEEAEEIIPWKPKEYVNPYGEDWYMSACPNHYHTALAYEEGWRDCFIAAQRAGVKFPQ